MVALTLPSLLLLTMSKRKLAQKPSSKHLNLYKKSYKGGGSKDIHLSIFADTLRLISPPTRVLYPGCHRHLTAALVYPDVTFIDYDEKVAPLYSPDDSVVRDYVGTNKLYEQESQYRFYCYNVNDKIPKIENEGYDLLISLSAGVIVEPCSPYVSKGGYLLVNDSHSDARTTFVNDEWTLVAYWNDETSQFTTDDLDKCFQVVDKSNNMTLPISKEQVQESIDVGTVSKRSFKLLMEPLFFLFQKN